MRSIQGGIATKRMEVIQQPANADNIVEIMCKDEAAWKAVRGAASKIMQRLTEDIEVTP